MGRRVIVTGGAGFIGSALCRYLIAETDCRVLNIDKLTYAASPEALAVLAGNERYRFHRADIRDADAIGRLFAEFRPDAVMHLAAESHVDRSIDSPAAFIETNVLGSYVLMEAARRHWQGLGPAERDAFRFLQVSTDEVYGSLGPEGAFTEESPYAPSSPYSASKAAADHLAMAWSRTYGLPVILTNCSNNYGPYQFPEKLIPLAVIRALAGEAIPVYGRGQNRRDWLHVEDHVRGLWRALEAGRPGERYNFGGAAERSNIEVVTLITALLDRMAPMKGGRSHATLIRFVEDRPGHDQRYAMDARRASRELGWHAAVGFEAGLEATLAWYLEHRPWWEQILAGRYGGERLGLAR
ncbi:MAG: dTDP-glucose 4,6-dehydratase [Gemmatimonadales bacterium]